MRAQGHQIDGIVTMEDLMEEIVGDIYDEYDVPVQPEDSVLKSEGVVEVDGGLILQEVEAHTGIDLPDDGSYQTVGGFIMARLGRVAKVGDMVSVPGYLLSVIEADRSRIARVRVETVDEPATPESPDAEGSSPTSRP